MSKLAELVKGLKRVVGNVQSDQVRQVGKGRERGEGIVGAEKGAERRRQPGEIV